MNILNKDIPPISTSYSDDLIKLIHRLLDKNSDSRPSIIELLMIPFVQDKMSAIKKKIQMQQSLSKSLLHPRHYSQSSTEYNSRLMTSLSNDEEEMLIKEHEENNNLHSVNILPITNKKSNTFLNNNQLKVNQNSNLCSLISNSSCQSKCKCNALKRKSVDAKKARKIINAYEYELQEDNSNSITPNMISYNISSDKPRNKSIATTKSVYGNIQLIDKYPKNCYTNNMTYKYNMNDSPHNENMKLSGNAIRKHMKTTKEILFTMDSNSLN